MNTITSEIKSLIKQCELLRPQSGINKKALNKAIANLEVAELWSERIINFGLTSPADKDAPCTCLPGSIDKVDCPVHAVKK